MNVIPPAGGPPRVPAGPRLRYVSTGLRRFGETPILPNARREWEFYAVVQGRVAPWTADARPEHLRSDLLWLFPPGHVHGWSGERGRPARVAVFHFERVPDRLAELTAADGCFSLPLDEAAKDTVVHCAREVAPRLWMADSLLEFHSARVLMELAILILSRLRPPASVETVPLSQQYVMAAETFFRERLSERLSLTNVARGIGISGDHLRRLFLRERQRPPKAVMIDIQIARASELLAGTDEILDVVAEEAGFAGASQLCRAFRRIKRVSPSEYRRSSQRR